MTNTALLYMNIHRHQRLLPPMSPPTEILLFVAFEHLVIGAKCVIAFAIPDVPEWVRKSLARTEWKSRQALRKERQVANKKWQRLKKSFTFPSIDDVLIGTD